MNKIDREKHTVGLMIELYCRKKHQSKELCDECSQLLTYARERLSRCRYGNQKPACAKCKTHCYRKIEQERIRRVMRFSGPRMLFYNPKASIAHLFAIWYK